MIKSILSWAVLAALGALMAFVWPEEEQKEPHVLVFSKTEGFRHKSIEKGIEALKALGDEHGFEIHATEDAATFTPSGLRKYQAVIFLNTTGDVLNDQQQIAFENYIRSGGGYVGIHAASDTEFDWPWYGDLVGAYFMDHPKIQEAEMEVLDHSHPATSHLPGKWVRTDEWYNFKDINPAIRPLINLVEKSYEGGKNGEFHPVAWYHDYDGGKAFYTAGGHTAESYEEPLFLQHLLGGIRYALGMEENNSTQGPLNVSE